jgi:porin
MSALLCGTLLAPVLILAEEAQESSPSDSVKVDGDWLRGSVSSVTMTGIVFETVYGTGALSIPFDKIDKLMIGGVEEDLAPLVSGKTSSTNDAIARLAEASPDSIDSRLNAGATIQQEWIMALPKGRPLKLLSEFNQQLDRKLHLRFGLAYTSLGMAATDAPYGDDWAAAGDFDFFGRWRAWGIKNGDVGTFAFNLRHRHAYSDLPPSRLNRAIGSPWAVTSGFSDTGGEITEAYLDQSFLNGNVGIRIGQIFQDNHFDGYAYKSQKRFFLNAAFSDNPAVAFPDSGIGFVTIIRPYEDWYFLSGAGDSSGRKLSEGTDSLFGNTVFSGLEVGWSPSSGLLQDQSVALFSWFAPAEEGSGDADGSGATFTYQWQPAGEPIGLFFRYAWSGSSATLIKTLATSGAVWEDAFGIPNSLFGLAYAWGDPVSRDLERPDNGELVNAAGITQTVVEIFQRFQVTPLIELTPDIQLLFDPAYNESRNVIGVFSLRARVTW